MKIEITLDDTALGNESLQCPSLTSRRLRGRLDCIFRRLPFAAPTLAFQIRFSDLKWVTTNLERIFDFTLFLSLCVSLSLSLSLSHRYHTRTAFKIGTSRTADQLYRRINP